MDAFDLRRIREQLQKSAPDYHEFLRVPALSAGLYRLPAGSADPQRPHGEDELYYVLAGHAVIQVDGQERPVAPGDLIYVPARAAHHFHSIAADLTLLVIFAPAESTAEVG